MVNKDDKPKRNQTPKSFNLTSFFLKSESIYLLFLSISNNIS